MCQIRVTDIQSIKKKTQPNHNYNLGNPPYFDHTGQLGWEKPAYFFLSRFRRKFTCCQTLSYYQRKPSETRRGGGALDNKPTADLMPFSDLKPLTAKYVYQVWKKEWDETGLVSNKFHEILPKLRDKLLSFCNTRKENIVLNRLHIGHSYLTLSFILRKEEAPVCVACNAVITVSQLNIS